MSGQLKPNDEFDAVRMVVEILKDLKADEQARVVRWAQEKLGFVGGAQTAVPGVAIPGTAIPGISGETPVIRTTDISSFIRAKNPTNDVHFATAVAYFYAFEAPAERRAPEIDAAALQEATRLSGRPRLQRPITTLHNAVARGYLDKGTTRGLFAINTVGENLVAMSLPAGAIAANSPKRSRSARKK